MSLGEGSQGHSPQVTYNVDTAVIRRLLDELLSDSVLLQAFLIDRFPDLAGRLGADTDRMVRVNLLLCTQRTSEILNKLREHFARDPEQLAAIDRILAEPVSPEVLAKQQQQSEIERLYLLREKLVGKKQSTVAIDDQIVTLKRRQRQNRQLQVGDWFAERYRLIEELGRGGFAVVWRAFDVKHNCSVAVKVMHFQDRHEQQRMDRFRRGARKMRAVKDGHVVLVLDGPSVSDGFDYFVMEYLSAGDLARAIIDKRLDWQKGLASVLEIGEAMGRYHSQGIVHRDIKPQNILLDERGVAKLSDFDLVLAPDSTGGTRPEALGTFNYAAPEAIADGSKVDQRADLYSLGVTVFFVLLGKPLPGDFIYYYRRYIDELKCSTRFKEFILKAVDVDPKNRFQSAQAFCQELKDCLDDKVDRPTITAKLATLRPWNQLLPLLGIGCVCILIAGAWRFWPWRKPSQPPLVDSNTQKNSLPPDGGTESPEKPAVLKPESGAFQQSVNTKRESPDFFLSLAHAGQLDAALALYNNGISVAVQQQPIVDREYKRILPIYIKSHLRQAKSARKKGRCDEFEANILLILNLRPDEPGARSELTKKCKNKKPAKHDKTKKSADPTLLAGAAQKPADKNSGSTALAAAVPGPPPAELAQPAESVSPVKAATPNVPEPNSQRVRSGLFRAEQHYAQGRYLQAIKLAQQVQSDSPSEAGALIARAACKLNNAQQAADVMPSLSAMDKKLVIGVCKEAKFEFRDGKFY